LRRKVVMSATKAELANVSSRVRKVSSTPPKVMSGSIELFYNGQKALVDATFRPKVYRD
jgi:hypothetical protein